MAANIVDVNPESISSVVSGKEGIFDIGYSASTYSNEWLTTAYLESIQTNLDTLAETWSKVTSEMKTYANNQQSVDDVEQPEVMPYQDETEASSLDKDVDATSNAEAATGEVNENSGIQDATAGELTEEQKAKLKELGTGIGVIAAAVGTKFGDIKKGISEIFEGATKSTDITAGADNLSDGTGKVLTAGGAVSGSDSTKDATSKMPTLEELKAMEDSGMTKEEIQAEVQKQTGVTPTEKISVEEPLSDATKAKMEEQIKEAEKSTTQDTKTQTASGAVSGSDNSKNTTTVYDKLQSVRETIAETSKKETETETASGDVSGSDSTKETPIKTAGGVVSGSDSTKNVDTELVSDGDTSTKKVVGTVKTNDLNSNLRIHSSADTNESSRTGEKIKSGTEIEILDESTENGTKMYYVKTSDGKQGWVSSDYVQTEEKTVKPSTSYNTEKTYKVKTQNDNGHLNVRTAPGTDSEILGMIDNGDSVEVLGEAQDGWVKIKYNGQECYVSAKYLEGDR